MKPNSGIIVLISLFLFQGTSFSQESKIRQNKEELKGWDKTLIESEVFTRDYTALLDKAISGITPGKALDVTMGEGRNSLFLARNGWKTTGFDIAKAAMDSAKSRAAKENLIITTIAAKHEDFDYGIEKWDLVAILYADIICGGCCAYDNEFISTISKSLKPGGRLVYEWFTRDGLLQVQPGVKDKESWGCKDNTVLNAFIEKGDFEIVYYEEKLGIPDWDPSKKFEPIKIVYLIADKK